MTIKHSRFFPNVTLCTPDSLGDVRPADGFQLLVDGYWFLPKELRDEIDALLASGACRGVLLQASDLTWIEGARWDAAEPPRHIDSHEPDSKLVGPPLPHLANIAAAHLDEAFVYCASDVRFDTGPMAFLDDWARGVRWDRPMVGLPMTLDLLETPLGNLQLIGNDGPIPFSIRQYEEYYPLYRDGAEVDSYRMESCYHLDVPSSSLAVGETYLLSLDGPALENYGGDEDTMSMVGHGNGYWLGLGAWDYNSGEYPPDPPTRYLTDFGGSLADGYNGYEVTILPDVPDRVEFSVAWMAEKYAEADDAVDFAVC